MFEKLLVANRGEIAVRVIRACRELNIRTVAVYSEADSNSMHAQLADDAICIGGAASADSYLRIDRIIGAAEISDVDAIHPGYGFLSENAHFAEVCENCNIRFIGPKSDAMNALEDKALSRELARKAGVPIPPGSKDVVETEQEALKTAKEIGYPVMIKAVAGGGGRGMRTAHNDISLVKGYHTARSEAEKSFGNSGVYIEKFIENPHHIECQILGDSKGNIIYLNERECSIQRRNQKLIEIAPASHLTPEQNDEICETAVKAAKASNYFNAGTVEFLLDSDGSYYFMEINTRLQVEHTVTEMISGIDIVRTQIKLAMGKELLFSQEDIQLRGHAIELRINAEDPKNNFMPEGGKTVSVYRSPGGYGVRLDGFCYQGFTIPQVYDSLLVKLTVFGWSWNETVDRLKRCLTNYVITGPKTTIPFYLNLLSDPDFQACDFDTSFLETHEHLLDYAEDSSEVNKLASLIAEIHHKGENTYAA
ncbi:MAG: acetyl-CoA carboxylase biotin carboxylase subunit [Alcanivorax sp.]|nr:acetyl-CoA carboxylase biotin carboxylase subunit [Alcanivorax sp.]